MKAVILAGGLGTRMREETEFRPKPMVEVGGKPVLWHIMKTYAHYGVDEFIICAGYKASYIKNYFYNYPSENLDFTVKLGNHDEIQFHGSHDEFDWKVTVVDTGPKTMTAGRIKRVREFVGDEPFLCTYGDGIANVNIGELHSQYRNGTASAIMTVTKPTSRFGVVDLDGTKVIGFREKPRVNDWVSIGYFIFNEEIFDYIAGDETVLEEEPLLGLVSDGKMSAFHHEGFWQPMDTQREAQQLNSIWDSGDVPWKVWR